MAVADDSLSRYVSALLTQIEWGSPLLASSAGTAAWVHGTDAAWWLGVSATQYPEQAPFELLRDAQRYYDSAAPAALALSTRPERPPAGRAFDPACRLTCTVVRPPGISYSECVRHCEERQAGYRRAIGECGLDPECWAQRLAPWVIGVGLVVLGAWALVR